MRWHDLLPFFFLHVLSATPLDLVPRSIMKMRKIMRFVRKNKNHAAPLFLTSCLSIRQIQWIPCLSIRSEYKYELRFALLSDEWSCQTNSTSFQSHFLPLIPHSRTAGSCENWKWQSNQHVEQADWTKLSWPRSELFNTSAHQRSLCWRSSQFVVWNGEKRGRKKKQE